MTSPEADYVAEFFNQGTDTISFASMPIDVSMSLTTVVVQSVHVGRTVSPSSAITVENLIGGAGNDSLIGNLLGNVLTGNARADVMRGLSGDDTLAGGPGDDQYVFVNATALENDAVVELSNQGADILVFTFVTEGITLDLSSTSVQPVHVNRTLQLSSGNAFETVYCAGGDFADMLTGNGLTNYLASGGGNDTLIGGGGNDIYVFTPASSLEQDYLAEMPNEGIDTVDFSAITTTVTYNASLTQLQNVHLNRSFSAQLFDGAIDNIIGGSASDFLTGNMLANTITGGPGDDTITGADANDLLYGGTGDDTFVFNAVTSAEADYVAEYFNQGTDTITFASLPIDISMSLTTMAIQPVHVGRTLSLSSAITIENLIGGSGNDLLRGNGLANTLTGNAGNDQLIGGTGSDNLRGGPGDDLYVFVNATVLENDLVTELSNAGTDTLSLVAVTSNIALSLALTSVQSVHANRTLQLSSGIVFENVIAGSGNDALIGNSLANGLTGSAGNDSLNGAEGNDILFGGFGDDTFVFAPAAVPEADTLTEWSNQGVDTISFAAINTDVVLNAASNSAQNIHLNRTLTLASGITIDHVIGGSGNDDLRGNSLVNTLIGNVGNDRLNGGGGNDSLVGGIGDDIYVFGPATIAETDSVTEQFGEGSDSLSFASLSVAVTVNLGSIAVQSVHSNRSLQLNSDTTVENLFGGSAPDTLIGNTLNNRLIGNDGDDLLIGHEGKDDLTGGMGRDILIGGLGSDTLKGGLGDDVLIAGSTFSDASITQLHDLRTEWASANIYSTRTTNLRAGVGPSLASLKAGINVLSDSPAIDTLTGAGGTDWYFRALDDVITDLFAGEIEDLL